MPRCGLVYWKAQRVVGEGAYSPGLEHDAQLYETALRRLGFDVTHISVWCDAKDRQARSDALRSCEVVVGFEELGSSDLLQELRRLRSARDSRLIQIVLVPNLEVMSREPGRANKWLATLENMDIVDSIVCKTLPSAFDEFASLAQALYRKCRHVSFLLAAPTPELPRVRSHTSALSCTGSENCQHPARHSRADRC